MRKQSAAAAGSAAHVVFVNAITSARLAHDGKDELVVSTPVYTRPVQTPYGQDFFLLLLF